MHACETLDRNRELESASTHAKSHQPPCELLILTQTNVTQVRESCTGSPTHDLPAAACVTWTTALLFLCYMKSEHGVHSLCHRDIHRSACDCHGSTSTYIPVATSCFVYKHGKIRKVGSPALHLDVFNMTV